MAAKLSFRYDREADILHIDKCPPYAEQGSEELGDDVIARLNPKTGEVEYMEVLFFSRPFEHMKRRCCGSTAISFLAVVDRHRQRALAERRLDHAWVSAEISQGLSGGVAQAVQ